LEQESADLGSLALREHFLRRLWGRFLCFAQFDYSRRHSVLFLLKGRRGQSWRGALTPISPLAAITNRRRFFVNLLCGVTLFPRGGVTRFPRDRYLCWSCICGWHGNNLIGTRFGDAPSQSQELNRCCVLGLES
jgi:hypothetical protein